MGQKKLRYMMFIIILLQVINVLFWGSRKEGYYIDELWSYGLSNSYYEPFLQNKEGYLEQWHEPSFYKDYFTVSKEEAFSYASVYANQVQDVHPPLYYMLLHTACSLSAGKFSKWSGLLINLLFYSGTLWLVYEISRRFLGMENQAALLPPLLYGMSAGALSTAMYIRMYMQLTFFGMLFVLLTFIAMEDSERKKSILIALFLTTSAGFLTQYYFFIFAFFISAGYMLWRFWRRQFWKAIAYGTAVLLGIAAGISLFPASLSHIFLGQKGKDSFSNMLLGFHVFIDRIRQYADIVTDGFWSWGHYMNIVMLCLFVLGLFCLYMRKNGILWKIKAGWAKWWILAGAAAGYFGLVAQISTDVSDRYQFMIYPAGVLLFFVSLYGIFELIGKTEWIWVAAVCCLFMTVFHYGTGSVNYIKEDYGAAMRILQTKYRDVPGVYVTKGDHLVINDCLFLSNQDMTLPIFGEDLEKLSKLCENRLKDTLVLYVNIYYDEEETAKEVASLLGYQSVTLLYDNTYTQIYILSI